MKVLVAGAHGYTGQLLVEMLANDSNHEVYAMVRDYTQAGRMKQLGAQQIITADLENNVSKSPKGMDAVLFAAGSGSKTGPEKTLAVDQVGAKKLIDASRVQGVRHFVMLSSMGADNPDGPDKYYLEAKGAADAHLRSSGLPYTIVRTGSLTFDKGRGLVEIKEKFNDQEHRSISREDTARVMIASLTEENVKYKTFELLSGKEPIEKAIKKL
ncbi:SDR family oxidoreductase [Salibacterium aidingense]|uniref:SDR family oxidoreductase n=1 Tax=Salibacterium aidingense TaxID=384933 RepID=UPI000412F1FE|nr:SDR family oxidoreductase [Salibacterium aidingense]